MKLRTAIAAALALAALAPADTVNTGVPYAGVQVTDVKGGQVHFRLRGRLLKKPMKEVRQIEITDFDELNRAETLAQEKKYPEAAVRYEQALEKAGDEWREKLVRYRRLEVLKKAKKPGKAVADWLALLASDGASATIVELAPEPKHLAAKGSATNRKAIAALERASKTADEAASAAIDSLLIALYEREGLGDKAAALAERLTGKNGSTENGDQNGSAKTPGNGSGVRVGPTSAGRAQLTAARLLIEKGTADAGKLRDALKSLQSNLSSGGFAPADVPTALLLSGKARLRLYEKHGQRERSVLLRTGLDLMRIVALYGASAEAGEALYLAGRVNELLGNKGAAREAYADVVRKFKDTKHGRAAEKALQALK